MASRPPRAEALVGVGCTQLQGELGSPRPPKVPQALLWTLCWRPGLPGTGSGDGRLCPSCLPRRGGRAPLAGSCVEGGPRGPAGSRCAFWSSRLPRAQKQLLLVGDGGSGWEGRAASGTPEPPGSGLRVLQTRQGKSRSAGVTQLLGRASRPEGGSSTARARSAQTAPPKGLSGARGPASGCLSRQPGRLRLLLKGHLDGSVTTESEKMSTLRGEFKVVIGFFSNSKKQSKT